MDQTAAAPVPEQSTSAVTAVDIAANTTTTAPADKTAVVLPDTYCAHYVEFNKAGKPHGISFDFRNASGHLQVLYAAMFEDGVQVRKYNEAERRDAVILYFRARKQAQPGA